VKASIVGVGAVLPERVLTNAQLEQLTDTSDEWIVRRTGIRERHVLDGAGSLVQLATQACTAALHDAGRSPEQVDRLILASSSSDRPMPGMAPSVITRLGAGEIGGWDVTAACQGFLLSLEQAVGLIESGRAETVVVCAAEAISRYLGDYSDRSVSVIFGDGAGAVVVTAADVALGCGAFAAGNDGAAAELIRVEHADRLIHMQGREVYRHAVRRMIAAARRALADAGLEVSDIDLLLSHQANARIIETIAGELDVPAEKVMINIDHTGNTSAASIPLAMEQAQREGRLHPGQRVLMVAFGAGVGWSATVAGFKEAPVRAADDVPREVAA
jgi:3-oxoacyl-[acyl-carrier-protein] synthase-3